VNDAIYFESVAYEKQVLLPQDNLEWLTTTPAEIPYLWWLRAR
jgi:hypothetical protein